MALGKYKVPRALKDEDKWFKYFTKKQLAILMVVVVIDYYILRLFAGIKLLAAGIVIAITLFLLAAVIAMAVMPKSKYLFGGGLSLDQILLRIVCRKILKQNRVIYTSIEEPEEEDIL